MGPEKTFALSHFWGWMGIILLGGCSSQNSSQSAAPNGCAPAQLSGNGSSQGTARIFVPDPMSSTGNINLSPKSSTLDSFITTVNLSHLSGQGVLAGTYVEIGNKMECGGNFGAYDSGNQFIYAHGDWRFQEPMAYYFGDTYRSVLDQIHYLTANTTPVTIFAHCSLQDNAYFQRGHSHSGQLVEQVCLGDSVSTPGAFYADDAIVTVHELEHATTTDNYSVNQYLNQFWYDEAGALNEAISDFMSLVFTDSVIPPSITLDPRIFSRWALGTFDPNYSHIRGAHRCPVYDSQYPNCGGFPNFQAPSASGGGTLSYVYPDGMGWPYPNNFKGANAMQQAFTQYLGQEEIHNAGVLMLGALWDVYQAVKVSHTSNPQAVNQLMMKLVLEAVRNLPQPNTTLNHSPVNFMGFAAQLVISAGAIHEFSASDLAAIQNALNLRGLYQAPVISSASWLDVGPGINIQIPTSKSPGVYILDDPQQLQSWLSNMGASPEIVTQGLSTGLNSQLDPGEVAAMWFDLENSSNITAGGVLLTVVSPDPDLQILGSAVNVGYLDGLTGSNAAQIMYGKVNGTGIVSLLNPAGTNHEIPMGNTYFTTNPFFYKRSTTALWVKVSATAAHGKTIQLNVTAQPSNGVASVQSFPVTIN